jgi:lipopolysaccharide/colanic/teichoic acid biosynthesis glycosyltransferase
LSFGRKDVLVNQLQMVKNVPQDIVVRRTPQSFMVMKRLGDIIGSIIAIILTFPIVVVCCILIVLDSHGSPIFIQERLGLHGNRFKMIKLRTMKVNAEEKGVQWASKNDQRITRVGHFLRKKRFDEIPQLLNILMGEMAFVGPRPERPCFYSEFEKTIPHFRCRLEVKPGLTGWAQIMGGYELLPEQKFHLDLEYINKTSLWFDIYIIMKTFKVIFTGEGAR